MCELGRVKNNDPFLRKRGRIERYGTGPLDCPNKTNMPLGRKQSGCVQMLIDPPNHKLQQLQNRA